MNTSKRWKLKEVSGIEVRCDFSVGEASRTVYNGMECREMWYGTNERAL